MPRALFGGDLIHKMRGPFLAVDTDPTVVTYWDAQTGGTRYTDLQNEALETVDSITAIGGFTPPHWGPLDVEFMWADTGDGNRELVRGSLPGPPGGGVTDSELAGYVDTGPLTRPAVEDVVNDRVDVHPRLSEAGLSATYASADTPARNPALTFPAPLRDRDTITAMQAGHGWARSSGGGSSADDTSDYVLGSQSFRVTTATDGVTLVVDSPTLSPTMDLTGRAFTFLMKVTNAAAITDIRFYLGTSTFSAYFNTSNFKPETNLLTNSPYKEGEWCWVTLNIPTTGHTGTPDRSAIEKIRMRIQASVGEAVTVRLNAFGTTPHRDLFPNGVASVCFDDGRSSPFTLAKPKLDSLGWAPSLYLISTRLGADPSYLTVDQARQWRDYSGAEIGCHATTVEIHNPGMTALTPAQVEADLLTQRAFYYDNNLGPAEGLAWPIGMSNKLIEDAAAKVVSYGRGNTTSSRETWPPANLMRIRSQAISPSVSTSQMDFWINTAVQEKSWLCLTFHDVVTSGAGALQIDQAKFDDFMNRINNAGMEVLPVIDVLRKAY